MLAFDYTSLANEITAACRRAFTDLARAHPDEVPCAFALYSDEGAMTVCPAFDLPSPRAARLAAEPDAAAYHTFSTAEWSLEGFGADLEFEAICTRVRTHVFAIEADDDGFVAFRERLFETCIQVLARLRTEGAFDGHPGLLVMFSVSDKGDLVAEDELRMMQRLNGDSPHVALYRRWTETWGT